MVVFGTTALEISHDYSIYRVFGVMTGHIDQRARNRCPDGFVKQQLYAATPSSQS